MLLFSCPCQILETPWTIACQTPLSIVFPKQEYWNGLPCRLPGDLPIPVIQLMSPALIGRFFYHWATREVSREKKNRNSFIIVRLSLIRELFKHICVFTSLSPMRIQYHLIVTAFTSPVFFYAFSYTIPSVWNVHLLPCSLAAVCLTLAMSFALF